METIECFTCCFPMINNGEQDRRPMNMCANSHKICAICVESLPKEAKCPFCRTPIFTKMTVDTVCAGIIQVFYDTMQSDAAPAVKARPSTWILRKMREEERSQTLLRTVEEMRGVEHPRLEFKDRFDERLAYRFISWIGEYSGCGPFFAPFQGGISLLVTNENREKCVEIVKEVNRTFAPQTIITLVEGKATTDITIDKGRNLVFMALLLGFAWDEILVYLQELTDQYLSEFPKSSFYKNVLIATKMYDRSLARVDSYLNAVRAALDGGKREVPLLPVLKLSAETVYDVWDLLRWRTHLWMKNCGVKIVHEEIDETPALQESRHCKNWAVQFVVDKKTDRLYILNLPISIMNRVEGSLLAHGWVKASKLATDLSEKRYAQLAEKGVQLAGYLEGRESITKFCDFLGIHKTDIAKIVG